MDRETSRDRGPESRDRGANTSKLAMCQPPRFSSTDVVSMFERSARRTGERAIGRLREVPKLSSGGARIAIPEQGLSYRIPVLITESSPRGQRLPVDGRRSMPGH